MQSFTTDAFLKSPLKVEWLAEELSTTEQDELERAVAEKAVHILECARFTAQLYERDRTELEARVWLETAVAPAFVTVQVEPRSGKHYFLLMDCQGRERLGAIVFRDVPSVTAKDARAETTLFLDAFREEFTGGELVDEGEFVDRVRAKAVEITARDVVGR